MVDNKATDWNVQDCLNSINEITEFFRASLEQGDRDSFMINLGEILYAIRKLNLLKETGETK